MLVPPTSITSVFMVGIYQVDHQFLRNLAALGRGLLSSVPARGATVFQQPRHQSGPTRLMAGPEPSAGVAVKVFVKEHQIAPVRIGGETLVRSVTDAPAMLIGSKDSRQPRGQARAPLPADS